MSSEKDEQAKVAAENEAIIRMQQRLSHLVTTTLPQQIREIDNIIDNPDLQQKLRGFLEGKQESIASFAAILRNSARVICNAELNEKSYEKQQQVANAIMALNDIEISPFLREQPIIQKIMDQLEDRDIKQGLDYLIKRCPFRVKESATEIPETPFLTRRQLTIGGIATAVLGGGYLAKRQFLDPKEFDLLAEEQEMQRRSSTLSRDEYASFVILAKLIDSSDSEKLSRELLSKRYHTPSVIGRTLYHCLKRESQGHSSVNAIKAILDRVPFARDMEFIVDRKDVREETVVTRRNIVELVRKGWSEGRAASYGFGGKPEIADEIENSLRKIREGRAP